MMAATLTSGLLIAWLLKQGVSNSSGNEERVWLHWADLGGLLENLTHNGGSHTVGKGSYGSSI